MIFVGYRITFSRYQMLRCFFAAELAEGVKAGDQRTSYSDPFVEATRLRRQ